VKESTPVSDEAAGENLVDHPAVLAEYASFQERVHAVLPLAWLAFWNERNLDVVELTWSPTIKFHSPLGDELIEGRAELLDFIQNRILGAYSDFHYVIEDAVVENDRAAMRMTQTGRHTGNYFGLPPTGRAVTMTEIFMFRLAPTGGLGVQIEELWLVLNALYLLQQMGLFPKKDPPRPVLRGVIATQKLARKLRRAGD